MLSNQLLWEKVHIHRNQLWWYSNASKICCQQNLVSSLHLGLTFHRVWRIFPVYSLMGQLPIHCYIIQGYIWRLERRWLGETNQTSGIEEDFPKEMMFGLEDGLTWGKGAQKATHSRRAWERDMVPEWGEGGSRWCCRVSQGPACEALGIPWRSSSFSLEQWWSCEWDIPTRTMLPERSLWLLCWEETRGRRQNVRAIWAMLSGILMGGDEGLDQEGGGGGRGGYVQEP